MDYEPKAATRTRLLMAARLGSQRGYECQLPDGELSDVTVLRALALHDAPGGSYYRCAAFLNRDELKVDLGEDDLKLDFGAATFVDVPAELYDSWPSVHDALNAGARALRQPTYIQRFPERN